MSNGVQQSELQCRCQPQGHSDWSAGVFGILEGRRRRFICPRLAEEYGSTDRGMDSVFAQIAGPDTLYVHILGFTS